MKDDAIIITQDKSTRYVHLTNVGMLYESKMNMTATPDINRMQALKIKMVPKMKQVQR
jgi:hypothetical protein